MKLTKWQIEVIKGCANDYANYEYLEGYPIITFIIDKGDTKGYFIDTIRDEYIGDYNFDLIPEDIDKYDYLLFTGDATESFVPVTMIDFAKYTKHRETKPVKEGEGNGK